MKLQRKIFSMLITTFFLSSAVNADEKQGVSVMSANDNHRTFQTVSDGKNSNRFKADTATYSRGYVPAGGGGGAFPPDPSVTSTDTFCFLDLCFAKNQK